MNKEMIISSGDHETRVAILEDDQVVEVFIERENQRGVVGNVYKGRVNKVLPGMQSSFIDIGLERDAFLYVSEVVNTVEEFERLAGDEDDEADGSRPRGAGRSRRPARRRPDAPPSQSRGRGSAAESAAAEFEAVSRGRRRRRVRRRFGTRPGPGDPAAPRTAGGDAAMPAAVAPAPARSSAAADATATGSQRRRDRPEPKIEDLLKEGQDILVQVVKEPLGTKGARLTSHVTMPGRFLVFMPTVDHVGVSRKIDSREERGRLRGIVREFREQHGFTGGVIIRTAAAGRSKEDIVSDLSYFHQVWTEIRQKMEAGARRRRCSRSRASSPSCCAIC